MLQARPPSTHFLSKEIMKKKAGNPCLSNERASTCGFWGRELTRAEVSKKALKKPWKVIFACSIQFPTCYSVSLRLQGGIEVMSCHWMKMWDTSHIGQRARKRELTASMTKTSDVWPFHLGSLSGNSWPMSGRPSAPKMASAHHPATASTLHSSCSHATMSWPSYQESRK